MRTHLRMLPLAITQQAVCYKCHMCCALICKFAVNCVMIYFVLFSSSDKEDGGSGSSDKEDVGSGSSDKEDRSSGSGDKKAGGSG